MAFGELGVEFLNGFGKVPGFIHSGSIGCKILGGDVAICHPYVVEKDDCMNLGELGDRVLQGRWDGAPWRGLIFGGLCRHLCRQSPHCD